MTPSITENAVITALGDFLTAILPASCPVVQGQANRVPPPATSDYAVMTPFTRGRLATNVDGQQDVQFTAAIAGTTMTVASVAFGTIAVGAQVFGPTIAPNTTIVSGPGGGGAGAYQVSVSQTVSEQTLAAGTLAIAQATEMVVNVEVHGPNAGDNAQTVATLFRDEYATSFASFVTAGVSPLFAEDPKQIPFIGSDDQYQERYIVGVHMQIDPAIAVPQQFADQADVVATSVTTIPTS